MCSCSRCAPAAGGGIGCAPAAGGGIGCALSRKKRNQQPLKRKQRLTLKRVSLQLFLLFTPISSSRIENKSSTSQTSLLKKMIYLADHRPEKNLDEYTESILWLYLSGDRSISGAKRVHICWITNLFVSTPNLSHSSVCCRLK